MKTQILFTSADEVIQAFQSSKGLDRKTIPYLGGNHTLCINPSTKKVWIENKDGGMPYEYMVDESVKADDVFYGMSNNLDFAFAVRI